MTNEGRGCQHVAIKSRIKLKNLVLNSNFYLNIIYCEHFYESI